jgi:hypothetical protein
MIHAGIKVAASKNHVFAHLINGLDDRNDKETEELKRGIIPDAVMDCWGWGGRGLVLICLRDAKHFWT